MNLSVFSDEYFMKQALNEARKGFEINEVPVGAVVVCEKQIIARAHNLTEQLIDVTAHAEMQAFTAAANFLGSKYLNECTLYVTIEPCTMCAGASYWTQIGKIVYGADDDKKGYTTTGANVLHPKTKVVSGILKEECTLLMIDFFNKRRGF